MMLFPFTKDTHDRQPFLQQPLDHLGTFSGEFSTKEHTSSTPRDGPNEILILICAYLIGNLSSGYLVGRFRRIDIRQHGSGNIGATNVLRTLGLIPSLVTLVLDSGKGVLAVFLAKQLGANQWIIAISGIMVILGHNWPVFLGFKGGRGVATALGVILALMPGVGVFVAIIWFFLVFVTRYISVGSIGAALSLPIAAWLIGETNQSIFVAVVIGLLVVWRHRPNMGRLLAGEEYKIGQRVSTEKRS
jgi:glycerol-3-phosphate acyltransferase PlsY